MAASNSAEPVLNKILVLFAHPVFQTSLLNKSLLAGLPDSAQITVHDLYECYPNFMIDVEREQALLNDHDVIIFQHPMYWYSSPAILKEWMDLVLEHGYAYGSDAIALKGKQFLSVITSGGDVSNYQGEFNIRGLLKPFEYTAKLCNMNYLPPFITYAGLKIKAAELNQNLPSTYLQQQVSNYRALIDDLVHDRINSVDCENFSTMNERIDYLAGVKHD